jgi:predicted amidohydrolase YtcJ
LPGEHDQAEALAITKDSILIIGDEAARKPAVITLYRWP